MWFSLSVLALFMLSVRRSVERQTARNINSMAMAWLQQGVAMPFIVFALFFAKFYTPSELPVRFWELLAIYGICASVDLYCYFRAISIADISYVAPLLSLFAVLNIAGSYLILGQHPTISGIFGAFLIMIGALLNHLAKLKEKDRVKENQLALILVLVAIVLRAIYANVEVLMLRVSNPTSYNFYSSVVTVLTALTISVLITRHRKTQYQNYWPKLRVGVRQNVWPLLFIGMTYTINLLATYQAKLIGPNAGYVGAIKSAAVLPVVFIGIVFFKEKLTKMQWFGIGLILVGLVAMATN